MKKLLILLIIFTTLSTMPLSSAAHFIVGVVNDAGDSTTADEHEVVLWNPANGIDDNLTDTIGPTGSSGANNVYMIDCELLTIPCVVGDEVRVQVMNNGDNHITNLVNTSVTGAGFDIMPNLKLNSPPIFTTNIVDDGAAIPPREVDLTPAALTEVTCEGIVYEYDGDETLKNITAEFFDNTDSSYGGSDDNNQHYTNSTCNLNLSYGNANESYFTCSFQIEYYANSENWNCTTSATDNLSVSGIGSNTTTINSLIALSVPSPIDFGNISANEVGNEIVINVTNMGNTMINLSLNGYATDISDGIAMNCTQGNTQNISINYMKYNLTNQNAGSLTLTEFEGLYKNLTSDATINKFNLDYRQNDTDQLVDDTNSTYWRVYVPIGVAGSCTGNIVFGAIQGTAS